MVTAVLFVVINSPFFYFSRRITDERGTYCDYYGPEKYLHIVLKYFLELFILMLLS